MNLSPKKLSDKITFVLNELKERYRSVKYIESLERKFGAKIVSSVKFNICDPERFSIGEGTFIEGGSIILVLDGPWGTTGISHLRIGKGVYLGEYCNIRAAGGAITIGDNCRIGHEVSIIASNHQKAPLSESFSTALPWDTTKTGVVIGKAVWLGCKVIILPGVEIGDRAIVGAGAVVTKNVPRGHIVAGNPAKKIGEV